MKTVNWINKIRKPAKIGSTSGEQWLRAISKRFCQIMKQKNTGKYYVSQQNDDYKYLSENLTNYRTSLYLYKTVKHQTRFSVEVKTL